MGQAAQMTAQASQYQMQVEMQAQMAKAYGSAYGAAAGAGTGAAAGAKGKSPAGKRRARSRRDQSLPSGVNRRKYRSGDLSQPIDDIFGRRLVTLPKALARRVPEREGSIVFFRLSSASLNSDSARLCTQHKW